MGKKIIHITESQFKNLTSLLINEQESTVNPPTVTIAYKFKASYPVNSSDPSQFVKQFATGVLAEINKTPEGKQMLQSGQMTLYSGVITAGASNTWNNKATAYDKENNYTTDGPAQQNYDANYKLNVQLALKRAQDFRTYLFNILKVNKISDNPQAQVATKTMVVNTGGVKDESKDATKYPNPGQFIQVRLNFRYKRDIPTSDIPPETKKTIEEIKKGFVLTGSYYCNGKNSEGHASMADTYQTQCAQLNGFNNFWAMKENDKVNTPEYNQLSTRFEKNISAFEIKWSANVKDMQYTRPIIRWTFTWSPQGKIVKITRYLYDKEHYKTKDLAPQQNIQSNDKEMLYFMGINYDDPNGGGPFYQKYVKPYL